MCQESLLGSIHMLITAASSVVQCTYVLHEAGRPKSSVLSHAALAVKWFPEANVIMYELSWLCADSRYFSKDP